MIQRGCLNFFLFDYNRLVRLEDLRIMHCCLLTMFAHNISFNYARSLRKIPKFMAIPLKLNGNCALAQNFHTRKLDDNYGILCSGCYCNSRASK